MPAVSQALLFARNFFRNPLMLGAIFPSSRFLVNNLVSQINWEKAKVVVEYGPGVGTITRALLERMRPDAVLVVIELNEEFAHFLEKDIQDPRLKVVYGSAIKVKQVLAQFGLCKADYIISGIPFSSMPRQLRYQLARQTHEALGSSGFFLVYQYTRAVLPCLESYFSSVQQNVQLWNIPPTRTFYCTP
jgi:phospholipid N-methyltransferase